MSQSAVDRTKSGMIFAICAYVMWGLAPLYFKELSFIPAGEVLMHRVAWSALVLALLIAGLGYIAKVKAAISSPKVLLTLFAAGALLAINWLLFIWAVNNDFLLEASLGYYINPLFNVLFGRLLLGEKLRRLQKVAVAIVFLGVLITLVNYGRLPWIALVLAVSFSTYGLLRKQVNVDSMPGLFIETLMMLPAVVIYWIWFADVTNDLSNVSTYYLVLLLSAGIITTAPLLCFTAAARRLKYSTLGFFQYIGPSIMFCLATFYYQEPLTQARLLTFLFVWAALALFTFDSVRAYRETRKAKKLASAQPV